MIGLLKVANEMSPATVAEVFCDGNIAERGPHFGLSPGIVADLKKGWSLDKPGTIKRPWGDLRKEKHYFIILSPMCKAFGLLQWFNKGSRNYQATYEQGMRHFKLCIEIIRWQLKEGRFVFFEHPWSASS